MQGRPLQTIPRDSKKSTRSFRWTRSSVAGPIPEICSKPLASGPGNGVARWDVLLASIVFLAGFSAKIVEVLPADYRIPDSMRKKFKPGMRCRRAWAIVKKPTPGWCVGVKEGPKRVHRKLRGHREVPPTNSPLCDTALVLPRDLWDEDHLLPGFRYLMVRWAFLVLPLGSASKRPVAAPAPTDELTSSPTNGSGRRPQIEKLAQGKHNRRGLRKRVL